MSFSTSQIGAMAALVDIDKMTHEDAAKKWLADNKSVWQAFTCLLYTSPSPRDQRGSRMPSSA